MKHRWFKLFFIELPLVSFITLFVVVTIKALPTPTVGENIFLEYFYSHLIYLALPLMLYFFFLLLYIVIGTQISTRYNHPNQKNLGARAARYSFALGLIMIISFPLSFLATYFIAFLQINHAILSYNYGDANKKILTQPQAIADAIAVSDKLTITTINPATYKKDILLLYMRNKEGFYEDRFLNGFPNFLYRRSYLPYSSIVLVNNQLAAANMSPQDLAILSPALGRMIVENSLNNMQKPMPMIEVMKKNDYIAYRNKHIANEVGKIDDVIETVDKRIASISGFIATNENSVVKNAHNKEEAIAKGKTITCKTLAKCENDKKRLEKIIEQADKNIAKANDAMKKNQQVLGATINNKNSLLSTRNEIAVTQQYTDHELGVFVAPSKIKMTLSDKHNEVFDTYIATLAHEYFHYLSYVDEEHKLDNFFEEALTEYFARISVEHFTGKHLDVGYPMGYRIINAMTKDIPRNEFFNIYFSKDQKALENILNKKYGKDFYSRNTELFHYLSYLPFEQSLAAANLIMADIHAKLLKEEDFTREITFK